MDTTARVATLIFTLLDAKDKELQELRVASQALAKRAIELTEENLRLAEQCKAMTADVVAEREDCVEEDTEDDCDSVEAQALLGRHLGTEE